jgi:hypothetical protein
MVCCSSENFGKGLAMLDGSPQWSFGRLPDLALTIEDRLFGSDISRCTVWRFELREALARRRAAGRNGTRWAG